MIQIWITKKKKKEIKNQQTYVANWRYNCATIKFQIFFFHFFFLILNTISIKPGKYHQDNLDRFDNANLNYPERKKKVKLQINKQTCLNEDIIVHPLKFATRSDPSVLSAGWNRGKEISALTYTVTVLDKNKMMNPIPWNVYHMSHIAFPWGQNVHLAWLLTYPCEVRFWHKYFFFLGEAVVFSWKGDSTWIKYIFYHLFQGFSIKFPGRPWRAKERSKRVDRCPGTKLHDFYICFYVFWNWPRAEHKGWCG